MTIRHSALLAIRSPPRFSRCRLVLPEEAGSGATPHSLAKARLARQALGVVPGGDQQGSGDVGPHPRKGEQRRGDRRHYQCQVPVELGDLRAQRGVPTSEMPKGELRRGRGIEERPWPEPGGHSDQTGQRHAAERSTKSLRRREH